MRARGGYSNTNQKRYRRRTFPRNVPKRRRGINQAYYGMAKKELKFHDMYDDTIMSNDATYVNIGVDGTLGPDALNCIPIGTGSNQRVGRQVLIKSVLVQGHIQLDAESTNTAAITIPNVFIALVLDRQNNESVTWDPSNVFKNISGGTGTMLNPVRALEYIKRYKVLRSQHIWNNSLDLNFDWDGTNYRNNGVKIPFTFSYKWKRGLLVNYNGVANQLADITDNALHMCAITDEGAQGVDPTKLFCRIYYGARIRYVDA